MLHHTESCTLYLCHSCVFHRVCVWLPGVVVTSRVPSSLRPGECVWGESCPWLSWTQMCWTACTRWDASETESSSHVICNVKSKSFFFFSFNPDCICGMMETPCLKMYIMRLWCGIIWHCVERCFYYFVYSFYIHRGACIQNGQKEQKYQIHITPHTVLTAIKKRW